MRIEVDDTIGLVVVWDLHTHTILGWAYYCEMPEVVMINYLEVIETAQRRGVATLLLNFIQQQTNWEMYLGTQSSNHKARAFYKAVGFKETGRSRLCPNDLILQRSYHVTKDR